MKCKYCKSSNVVKAGFDYFGGKKQRYLCKDCGKTFIGVRVK